jgi:hypothetical protein
MIAPHYLTAALLSKAIGEATNILEPESIDKIEVVGDKVFVRAGGKRLTLTYVMSHGDTLGSWGWSFTSREVESVTNVGWLRRLLARIPRGKAKQGQ